MRVTIAGARELEGVEPGAHVTLAGYVEEIKTELIEVTTFGRQVPAMIRGEGTVTLVVTEVTLDGKPVRDEVEGQE